MDTENPIQENVFYYNIDISGTCNLRCPSCPRGNEQQHRHGFMDITLYESILKKIRLETTAKTTHLFLFNWGEPTLHPQLPKMIDMANHYGLPPFISTNLVRPLNLKSIINAQPRAIRISLSGMTPEIYNQTHVNGNLWLLKSNLYQLKALMEQQPASFDVELCYLKYNHNMGADYLQAKALAKELGFGFVEAWAFIMPLEKLLSYYEGETAPVQELVDRLVIKPEEFKEISGMIKDQHTDCMFRAQQTIIDFDGSVPLCCAVYSPKNFIHPNFLAVTQHELQELKYNHDLCRQCMAHHAHISYAYGASEQLDALGNSRSGLASAR